MTHGLASATRLRRRRSLAPLGAAVAAALALFFCIGHASHASIGMEAPDTLMHGVGICLLAAILLVALILPARPTYRVQHPPSPPAPSFAPVPVAVLAAPARASPAWLQRFRD